MKIVVAGSRTYKNHQHIYQVLDVVVHKGDVVLHGGALGVDRVVATWCRTHGIACQEFSAEWKRLGSAAGSQRNWRMAQAGDALVVFWDGESPGTGNMIWCMQRLKKPVFFQRLDSPASQESWAS